MAKLTLSDLASLANEASAVSTINNNNSAIETALENTLSRDGTSPNTMSASLDMNSQRIINLPTPGGDNDAARKVDIDNAILGNYSGQIINGTANEITASTVGTTTTLSLPTALTFTGKTVTGGTFAPTVLTIPAMTSAALAAIISDETGTGVVVLGTSPTITTPNIIGTATNNNAAAGSVGEFMTSTVNNVSLTTATPVNITSLVLTAGDWDIWAGILFSGTATTQATELFSSINTVTATNTFTQGQSVRLRGSTYTDPLLSFPMGPLRVSIASTTTYYLNAQATFTVSTLSASGILNARRRR